MTDKNIEIKNLTKQKTTLNLLTIKNVGRILKKIRETNNCSLSSIHEEMLKNVGLLELFCVSDSIASNKYPSPNDKDYLDYRIEHLMKRLRKKQLVIG